MDFTTILFAAKQRRKCIAVSCPKKEQGRNTVDQTEKSPHAFTMAELNFENSSG